MFRVRRMALVAIAALPGTIGVAGAAAQQGRAPAAPGRGERVVVVSPELHPDRRVTVRIHAPRASEVLLTGEITEGKPPIPLTRDATGVWSATVGPLAPDIYLYAFRVNGVNTPDPVNPYVKLVAGSGLATQVEVPGDGPQYYDMKPVPHGLVHILPYDSRALAVQRSAWIYTPPGYLEGTERYPVLYLLHGGGDTAPGWVTTGRANFILDNLIAEGKARPMVVVMPQGHVRQTMGVAAAATPTAGSTFEQDLMRDLIPLVERTFRVSTRPEDRAIMGLSMGGGLALDVGLRNLDAFRSVVALSAGGGDNPEQRFAALLANPGAANERLKLLHLTIGSEDAIVPSMRRLSETFGRAGIRHEFRTTPGGHWWRVWRRDLYEIAPMLFR